MNKKFLILGSLMTAMLILSIAATRPGASLVRWLTLQGDADGAGNSFTNLNSLTATGSIYLGTITGPATNQFTGGGGTNTGTTNFTLTGVVSGMTTNTLFSTAGSNYINAVAQAAAAGVTGPTNGVTAATATNIAAYQAMIATNGIVSTVAAQITDATNALPMLVASNGIRFTAVGSTVFIEATNTAGSGSGSSNGIANMDGIGTNTTIVTGKSIESTNVVVAKITGFTNESLVITTFEGPYGIVPNIEIYPQFNDYLSTAGTNIIGHDHGYGLVTHNHFIGTNEFDHSALFKQDLRVVGKTTLNDTNLVIYFQSESTNTDFIPVMDSLTTPYGTVDLGVQAYCCWWEAFADRPATSGFAIDYVAGTGFTNWISYTFVAPVTADSARFIMTQNSEVTMYLESFDGSSWSRILETNVTASGETSVTSSFAPKSISAIRVSLQVFGANDPYVTVRGIQVSSSDASTNQNVIASAEVLSVMANKGVAINLNDPTTNALSVGGSVNTTVGYYVNGQPIASTIVNTINLTNLGLGYLLSTNLVVSGATGDDTSLNGSYFPSFIIEPDAGRTLTVMTNASSTNAFLTRVDFHLPPFPIIYFLETNLTSANYYNNSALLGNYTAHHAAPTNSFPLVEFVPTYPYAVPVAAQIASSNLWTSGTAGDGILLTNLGLSVSAALDFPSTAAGAVSDLNISVPTAVDGDCVALGVPSAALTGLTGDFTAWASNAFVYVRFQNNGLVSAQDPPSATFKVKVFK